MSTPIPKGSRKMPQISPTTTPRASAMVVSEIRYMLAASMWLTQRHVHTTRVAIEVGLRTNPTLVEYNLFFHTIAINVSYLSEAVVEKWGETILTWLSLHGLVGFEQVIALPNIVSPTEAQDIRDKCFLAGPVGYLDTRFTCRGSDSLCKQNDQNGEIDNTWHCKTYGWHHR